MSQGKEPGSRGDASSSGQLELLTLRKTHLGEEEEATINNS